MERAEAPNKVERWRAANVAAGKEGLEGANGFVVGGVAELGDDHDAVSNQEIAVASWQSLSVAVKWSRQAEWDDGEWLFILVCHSGELGKVLLRWCKVVVGGIVAG